MERKKSANLQICDERTAAWRQADPSGHNPGSVCQVLKCGANLKFEALDSISVLLLELRSHRGRARHIRRSSILKSAQTPRPCLPCTPPRLSEDAMRVRLCTPQLQQ